MSRAEDNRKAGAAAVAWKARAERAEATLASLREENDRLVKGQRNGQSASLIVAELVALVPLKDTLAASANGKTLVEYFRSVLASNEALRVALEPFYKADVRIRQNHLSAHFQADDKMYVRVGDVYAASDAFQSLASLPKQGEGR